MNKCNQTGFTLVEIVVSIVVFAILAGGLVLSMSDLYKGSSEELSTASAENVARSALDQIFSGTYPPTNSQYTVGNYTVTIATSTNTSTTCTATCTHVKATVSCPTCTPISLSGDDYNVI